MAAMVRSLLLLATATSAAAYLQAARPPRLDRPKWDTFDLEELERTHETTQPPLSEKTLWERALERQEWEILEQPSALLSPPTKKERRATKKERLLKLAASGEIIQGEIVTVNRGGAICAVQGTRAFLPNSHLGEQPARIGQKLPLKVLRPDAATQRITVSHREANRATLRRGDIVHGVIKSLRPYGAFVSFGGGLQGLLHKHSISAHDWKLVRAGDRQGYVVDECFRNDWETEDVLLEVGSAVSCLVAGHNRENNRISLSTQVLEPEPGDMLRDPAGVFARAEVVAGQHRDRRAQELLEYEILASMCEENSLSSLLGDLLP